MSGSAGFKPKELTKTIETGYKRDGGRSVDGLLEAHRAKRERKEKEARKRRDAEAKLAKKDKAKEKDKDKDSVRSTKTMEPFCIIH
jgi:hypothetical protein